MTKEEYLGKEKELKSTYERDLTKLTSTYKRDLQSLKIEYATSNNPYKIGDIITDNIGTIIIEKINVAQYWNYEIGCIYTGIELCKNGSPKKKQGHREVYQCNVKSVKSKEKVK